MNERNLLSVNGNTDIEQNRTFSSFMDLMKENIDGISLFDGIGNALRELPRHSVPLTVVSSNAEHNVRRVLGEELAQIVRALRMQDVDIWEGSPDWGGAERRWVEAVDAIYIGDQGTDAEAPQKVTVAFGAVCWGDAAIESLRKFRPVVESETPGSWWGLGGLSERRLHDFHAKMVVRAQRLRAGRPTSVT